MTAAQAFPAIALTMPFPREHYSRLWEWTLQHPERMLDDFSSIDPPELARELDRRATQEITALVSRDGAPVGFLSFARLSPHLGTLRGVCFDPAVHGDGTALRAMRAFLQQRFDAGAWKIQAWPFADNARAIAFYKKLGACEEGLLRQHTRRGGRMVDVRLLAFFADSDGYRGMR